MMNSDFLLAQSNLHQLQHQAVRDLAWCCFSPPLLQELPDSDASIWHTNDPERDLMWLKALDRHPEPLLTQLASTKSTRLGLYYENLWHFYWQQHPNIKLLAHNLPVYFPTQGERRGVTQGAFDFLLHADAHYWHLEAAVKFYLGAPEHVQADQLSASAWHRWIGPRANDRLDIKLKRLIQHQLPLSTQQNALPELQALTGQTRAWQRALLLQGYFFYPAMQTIAAPLANNPKHLRGNWWYLTDFLATNFPGYWLPLAREQWLSPAQTNDLHALYSGVGLRQLVQDWVGEKQRPLLLAAVKKSGNKWLEQTRSFIVPDYWPATERPSRNT